MSRTKSASIFEKILFLITGAFVGSLWAFLKTWLGAANYFNFLGTKALIFGILLGWIPAIAGAIAGFIFGGIEGAKLNSLDEMALVLKQIDKGIKFAEGQVLSVKMIYPRSELHLPVSAKPPIYRPVKRKTASRHASVRH